MLRVCLRSFAEDIDGIILDLKNKYLNVNSREKPEGLFRIELTAPLIHLVRAVAQKCADVEEFVHICAQVFWVALSPSLEEAQRFLTDTTKKRAVHSFERVRAGLIDAVGYDLNYAELSTALGDASARVQAELDRMAGWLERHESQVTKSSFTLRQAIEIAIESVISGYKPFEPIIHLGETPDLNVSTNELVIISDIVRVALGNVHQHSSTKKAPNIWIETTVDNVLQVVSFLFKSDVGPKVQSAEAECKLRGIRAQIEDGTFVEKVRQEGETGLLKLANLVLRSTKGGLDFGFGAGLFYLRVDLEFTVTPKDDGESDGHSVGRRRSP